jgi:Dioxygenase
VPGAPELPKGAMVEGDPLDVKGKIHDPKGQPIANALIDVWQAGEDGLYSSQDPNKSKYELRGKFRSDRDGSYHFRSVVPKGYQIPTYRGEAFVVLLALLALLEKTGIGEPFRKFWMVWKLDLNSKRFLCTSSQGLERAK